MTGRDENGHLLPLTDTELEQLAAERAEQGLPPKVTDPTVLAKVGTILANADRRKRRAS